MVVDASAILAVLLGEPEAAQFIEALAADSKRLVGPVSVLEATVVLEARKGPEGARQLDLFLHAAGLEVVNMTADHLQLARHAYRKYGKGRHPASLNLGDCCTYGLARWSQQPLLFKGNDFSQTDLELVKL